MKRSSLFLFLPLICLAPCFSSAEVSSEDFTLAKSDANAPSAKFQYSTTSNMDFDSGAGGFSLQRLLLEAPLGGLIHWNAHNALSVGLRYETTWMDSDVLLGKTDLHDARISLTWLHHSEGSKWSILSSVSPGLATDFNHLNGDDFSLNWKVGVRYLCSDQFALVAGLGSDNTTGDTSIFPALGFQWQATDDVYVSLIGATFTATWQPAEDWLLRFGVWPAGGIWNVERAGASLDVSLSSYRAAVGLEHQISDKIWLSLWAGTTLSNQLEIETTHGTNVFRDDADSTWFVTLGLRVAAW